MFGICGREGGFHCFKGEQGRGRDGMGRVGGWGYDSGHISYKAQGEEGAGVSGVFVGKGKHFIFFCSESAVFVEKLIGR